MKRDRRLSSIVVTTIVVIAVGGVVMLLPQSAPLEMAAEESGNISAALSADPRLDPAAHQRDAKQKEIRLRFNQAVSMLHARQYEYAIKALHRVLELSPRMPEAHVNMGYALIGMKEYKAAADFFDTATAIRPTQLNAYYGLALAYEGQNNYPLAISAMESFIHLAKEDHPYMKKARSATWEWNEAFRIARSGESAPRVIGRDIDTKELVDSRFGESK